MKQVSKFLFLVSIAFLSSCSNDDDAITTPEPLGAYENGYFILNEGGSNTMTASVTYISENGTQTDDVFRIENPDQAEIGTFLQNIFFDDTRAFIVSGSTNSVTVYNRYTFEYITTITSNISTPRYGTVLNGKAYVTNQDSFSTGTDDFITVINLEDYSTSQIAVGDYVERITNNNGNIYIMNGTFGSGNAITVLNPTTEVITPIDLGAGNSPNSMSIEGNTLYTLTSSQKLIKVNLTNNVLDTPIDIPTVLTSPKNLDLENGMLYFTSGTSVYSLGINDTTISTTPIATYVSTSAFGSMYGFNVENGVIHISDAGDFNSNGQAFEYSIDGDLLESRTVQGNAPNGFYFN
ncbi:YncE family protein [uncultured Lacinutrix sp.]|uniref:YncE family protein n=1 Tax=uncultured Lacinutrix sp. TaxID=574032 RepID=UPI0026075302|nr:DUF5074 domain-containing protein [uncultured Lacinutrix sp.]